MSKEKQIIEMAEILLETSRQDSKDKSNNKSYTAFDADVIFKYGCDRLNGASALYNADYRKQSEGEWAHEFYPYRVFCSKCKAEARVDRDGYYSTSTFCPDCGAKMKGGAE